MIADRLASVLIPLAALQGCATNSTVGATTPSWTLRAGESMEFVKNPPGARCSIGGGMPSDEPIKFGQVNGEPRIFVSEKFLGDVLKAWAEREPSLRYSLDDWSARLCVEFWTINLTRFHDFIDTFVNDDPRVLVEKRDGVWYIQRGEQ